MLKRPLEAYERVTRQEDILESVVTLRQEVSFVAGFTREYLDNNSRFKYMLKWPVKACMTG